MEMKRSMLAIGRFTFAFAISAVAAERGALDFNDFSYYRWTGAGETFAMRTAAVTTNLAARQKFWKGVAADRIPVIYQLTFPNTPGWKHKLPKTPGEALAAIDGFFAPGDGVEPCPERIFAVTPCEENVTWDGQKAVQDAIAKHLRRHYGVKTYQWLTEPMKPVLGIQADGWVFDAYCITDPDAFYAHVESFILTGVPVVPCIWASGHFCNYHRERTWDDLTRFTVERMDICRALDLPVMVFAVCGRQGSVGLWFKDADDPGERYYRETIRHYLAAMPTMPKASWKPSPKTWHTGVGADGSVHARISLKSFDLVKETEFDDVRKWRLGETGLSFVAADGTNLAGRLVWRIKPSGRVRKGCFSLRHSPGAKGFFCETPLSASGLTTVVAGGFSSTRTLVLETHSAITLAELSFAGEGEGETETVELAMDVSGGRTDYRAEISFDRAEGGLSAVKGRVARKRIVRRVSIPGCAGTIMATAKTQAVAAHGGSVAVSVFLSPDDATPLASATTDPAKHQQDVGLECRIPGGLPEIFIVFDLAVSCGKEVSGVSAAVKSCDFAFRPAHP